MLRRYTIRLGDGTVLKVDPDGLNAWREDGEASVQVPGTQEWRSLRDFLAEEQSAARLARALVPPASRPAPAAPLSQMRPRPVVEPFPAAPPVVQALAEDPAAPVPPWLQSPAPTGEAPILRLKPLEDETPAPHERPRAWESGDDGDKVEDEAPRQDRLDGPLLRVLSALGSLLSRCLDPLTPLVRGWPSTRSLGDAGRLGALRWQGLRDRWSGWIAALTARVAALTAGVGRLAEGRQPEPLVPPEAHAPKGPPPPAPRAPLAAPLPVSELPVLRFADSREPQEAEEVYEGEEGAGLLSTFWHWTWRVVLAGALVGGGVLAAIEWRAWFPRAAELGQTVFTGIDQQVRSGQRAEERQEALREATERLPHLTPETIGLVLAARAGSVLAPPEVFGVAREAAERGLGALTPAEAAELLALQRELLDHLRPPERARLVEYDRARARRVVFPFENPHALELVARGARDMPAPSRERLRTLLGKAVAAGLHDAP